MSLTLTFNNVNYSVTTSSGKGEETKQILSNVGAYVKPGEVLAVMGPSGSGKTSLLNILSGRAKPDVGSQILFNGKSRNSSHMSKIGYVMQSEIFLPSLTVKQTLEFTALLRLPKQLTDEEKLNRVDVVTNELGLTKCLNTKLGDAAAWDFGVSGGEKKRVNIANELITDPSLFILDEPTSGLDSNGATNLLTNLKTLAQNDNKTIIISIHQPSSTMFAQFDKLLVLMNGKVCFFNRADNLLNYLNSIENMPKCPPGYNVADHLMDICKNEVNFELISTEYSKQSLLNTNLEIEDIKRDCEIKGDKNNNISYHLSRPSWLYTTRILTKRVFLIGKDNFSTLVIAQTIIIATFCGLIYWRKADVDGDYHEDQIKDVLGLVFFALVYFLFVPMFTALNAFPPERAVITKERTSKAYGISSYFVAKCFGQIPLALFLPFIYSCIFYPMVGLGQNFADFILWLLVISFSALVGDSVGLFVGAWKMDVAKGNIYCSIFTICMLLVGGYNVNISSMPVWIRWIAQISPVKHAFDAAGQIFIKPHTYIRSDGVSTITGEEWLEDFDLNLSYGISLFILFMLQVIIRTLAYVMLRWSHNLKPSYKV